MSRRWLARVAIVTGAAAALLGFSSAAWADVPVPFNQQLPATADDFENVCDPNQGGTPAVGFENWVFVLPDNSRDFVSVTVTFGAGPAITIDNDVPGADSDGNDISDPGSPGTSKAWITVPAGSTLTAASAVATGSPPTQGQLFFVVTHTCAGGTTSTPSETPSETPSTPSETPSESGSTPGTSSSTPGGGGGLPKTGAGLTGLIVTGLALTIGGAALLWFRRKRDELPGETPAS